MIFQRKCKRVTATAGKVSKNHQLCMDRKGVGGVRQGKLTQCILETCFLSSSAVQFSIELLGVPFSVSLETKKVNTSFVVLVFWFDFILD